ASTSPHNPFVPGSWRSWRPGCSRRADDSPTRVFRQLAAMAGENWKRPNPFERSLHGGPRVPMAPDLSDPRGVDPDLEERRVRPLLVARMFEDDAPAYKIGRFTVLDRVGRGGVGDVYAAYDPQLDRKV